jgi:hypothetical protein
MDDAFRAVRCGGKLLEGTNAAAVAEKRADHIIDVEFMKSRRSYAEEGNREK